ncbi:hypothetical protein ACFVYJ_11370 [Pontibacter sp. JAM-7]|uniref:hypothetical protein n=1 Tax=Pontibacter sp. JAM-7 TaxID=3366581 RepID=UPI003AF9895D
MNKIKATKEMRTVFLSEVYGEAAFKSAFTLSSGDKKRKAGLLWQLESQTKQCVAEYYESENIGLPLSVLSSFKGKIIGAIFPFFPWRLVLNIILFETKGYFILFERLESQADEKHKAFFKYLVDHEIAVRVFAQQELDRNPEAAEQAIITLLKT